MTEERKRGYFRFGMSLLLVAGSVAWPSSGHARAAGQEATEARKVAATVNGQPIYEDQLTPALEKSLRSLRKHGMRKGDNVVVKRMQARLLNKAIGDMLINQESSKLTVENIEEKVEQKVQDLEKKFGAGQGMEKYLKIRRITPDQLRESLKVRVRIEEYLREQGALDPEIPEEQIRAMYDSDPDGFSNRETATVSHVLIAVNEDAGPEEKGQARQKAERIRQEILEGSDFAAMAKEHSTCSSAAGGGSLGRIKRGFMPAEFDTAAFALEKDAVSEVVETRFGFHIIKLVEKDPGGVVPYEQMRDFLKKYLQDEEATKRLASHIAELRKNAEIEIFLK